MAWSRPISLSDAQLRVVLTGAEAFPAGEGRSRYLAAIADLLTNMEINDIAVALAVETALSRLLPAA